MTATPNLLRKSAAFTAGLVLCAAISTPLAFAEDTADPTTVDAGPPPAQFTPMTKGERLGHYVYGLVDAESVIRAAASGGIRQASGSPKEWGGGLEGYGYRVGNSFAQHFIDSTIQFGISSVL